MLSLLIKLSGHIIYCSREKREDMIVCTYFTPKHTPKGELGIPVECSF